MKVQNIIEVEYTDAAVEALRTKPSDGHRGRRRDRLTFLVPILLQRSQTEEAWSKAATHVFIAGERIDLTIERTPGPGGVNACYRVDRRR